MNLDHIINAQLHTLCEECQQPRPVGAANRKYCSIKCLKRAERKRAKDRDSMFFGAAPTDDPRYLWSEPNPLLQRLHECVAALRYYNQFKPQALPEKVIEFTVSVPYATGEDAVPVSEDYELFQLRDWVGGRVVMLNKWILQKRQQAAVPLVAKLNAPAHNVVPEHTAVAVKMQQVLSDDEEIQRRIMEEL